MIYDNSHVNPILVAAGEGVDRSNVYNHDIWDAIKSKK
jgi:hypothetical protein